MKTDAVFKRASNRAVEWLATLDLDADTGSEPAWARRLGVSRTTVRAIHRRFVAIGVLALAEKRRRLRRHPTAADRFPEAETRPVREIVEKRFMQWMLEGDRRPGQQINGLELAREFGVSASAIRDYLNVFARFGLVVRRPSGSWTFKGFTADFAEELFEIRAMFELRAARRFVALPIEHSAWRMLLAIRDEHVGLRAEGATRFAEFSELDERFHRFINDVSRNRFIVGFYDVISLIFHYHYQWNKRDERERNIMAIDEHLAFIDALLSRDVGLATAMCRRHLSTARATLLAAIRAGDGAPSER